MDPNIIGQILGIFAPILTVVTYQMNTKKSLLIVLTSATVCMTPLWRKLTPV